MPKYSLEVGGKTFDVESDRPLSNEELVGYARSLAGQGAQPSAPPGQIPEAGPFVAPPAQPDEVPLGRRVAQTLGNVVAGGARGAASIGSTLTEIARTGFEELGGQPLRTIVPRIQERGRQVSAGLQTLGAEPESFAFQAGKIGGEVAGTLGVGPALATGARAVGAGAPVVAALQSGGLGRTGAATLPSGAVARVGAGATTGGISAGLVSPDEAAMGAGIGAALPAVLGPIGTAGGAVYRAGIEPLMRPGITAENALLGALGGQSQEAINALRATQALETTPGFQATMAERLVEGGVRNPTVAAMESRLAGNTPELNRRALEFAERRVGALQGQLDRINQQLQQQTAALRPEARVTLEYARRDVAQNLARVQQEVDVAQRALSGGLADVSQLEVGGKLSAAAAKELESAKSRVTQQYNEAFKLAGTDASIPFQKVVERAGILRDQPIIEFKGLAPETAKVLELYGPKVPEKAVRTERGIWRRPPPTEALPPMVTLEQASALGKALNIDYAALKGSTDAASNIARANINKMRSALDEAIASSKLSDEAKAAYTAAKQSHATQVAERFYTGTASKMFREGASNVALLGDESMAQTVLRSETGARDILAAIGRSPETRESLAKGVEDLFRRSVVDPTTKTVKPEAVARFLQDNAKQLDAIGGGLRQRLEQVQQAAANLSDEAVRVKDVSGKLVGRTANEMVEFGLQNPRNLKLLQNQLSPAAKNAVLTEFSDRATAGLRAGEPKDSVAFLTKNADTLREAFGRGTFDNLMRQSQFAEEVAKQQSALKAFSKNVEGVVFTRTQNFTPQQLTDLSLVAKDLERAQRAASTAQFGQKAAAPDVGELATEAAREGAGSARQFPTLLNRAMTFARNTWVRLEDRINRKAAGELYALMIDNPTAAIAALERAQIRATGAERLQRGAGAVTRAAAQTAIVSPASQRNNLAPAPVNSLAP